MLGRGDAIPNIPVSWEDLIKTDMFPVCFDTGVLAFSMPGEHARKFLTSCTPSTKH